MNKHVLRACLKTVSDDIQAVGTARDIGTAQQSVMRANALLTNVLAVLDSESRETPIFSIVRLAESSEEGK